MEKSFAEDYRMQIIDVLGGRTMHICHVLVHGVHQLAVTAGDKAPP